MAKRCLLCLNKCSVQISQVEKKKTFDLTQSNPPQGDGCEDGMLENQLRVIFLIRKMLEIPQDICCTFLEYGDPCSWIGCCDSCIVLIQNGKHIFDQIIVLQKKFQALQNEIKGQITSFQMEGKFDEEKERVEEIIWSYINKENAFPTKEYTKHDPLSADLNTPNSDWCLPVASYDASNIIVKNEVDATVYPLDVPIKIENGVYCSEESDPLVLNDSQEVNEYFDLENEKETEHSEIILPKSEVKFHSESSHMDLSSIFYEENEAGSSRNCPQIVDNKIKSVRTTKAKRKRFSCDICGKIFTNNRNLKVHRWTHTGERPYKCVTCGQSFTQSGALSQHKMVHIGERLYHCKICGQSFTRAYLLAAHQSTHAEINPYKCLVCGKGFRDFGRLNRHTKIHTGEKRFKCDICGKGFTDSSQVKRHARIHTGEKPFACEFCGKAFAQSYNVIKHRKTHFRKIRTTVTKK